MAQPNLVALAAQKIESLLGQKEQEVKQHRENLDVLEKTKQTLKQQSYNAKQKNDRKSAQALASELSRIEKELKQATKLWNEASSFLTELSEINRASTNNQLKWIKKYEQTHGPINPVTSTILATTTSDPIITTPQILKNSSLSGTYTLFSEIISPSIPKVSPCQVQTETINKITKVTVKSGLVFKFTPEPLTSYYKDRAYIEAEAQVSTQPGFKYLSLIITIHSDRARQSFGQWSQGALLTLYLNNGESIVLSNSLNDGGNIDYQNKETVYTGNFVFTPKEEKILEATPIDKMRIVWSTGFEEYDLYQMDFLMNLIRCIQNYD